MQTSAMTDVGQTSANAMLTAKAAKAVSSFITTHQIDARQAAVLGRAAKLLSRIVEGSLLIENRQAITGLTPSHVGLAEYERALSAAKTLNLLSTDLTELFLGYRSCLISLSEGAAVGNHKLDELKQFLTALSEFFYSDLV